MEDSLLRKESSTVQLIISDYLAPNVLCVESTWKARLSRQWGILTINNAFSV